MTTPAVFARGIAPIEVDGIRSVPRVWVRRIFDVINDHPWDEKDCPMCRLHPYHTKDTMRWMPGDPIVRFTSEGLQV